MKEPSIVWFLHLFSSETALTEIIKYIIVNSVVTLKCSSSLTFQQPIVPLTTPLFLKQSLLQALLAYFPSFNLQLLLFGLVGFSSPLFHTHLFRCHLPANISQICLQVRSLLKSNSLLNISTSLYCHFNMSRVELITLQSCPCQ